MPSNHAIVSVIVIGAGWSGLAAAKTYLQINPAVSLTILSDDTSVGGVWSRDRLYPGLVANSPNGLYEFSDLSMVDAAHAEYGLILGERVQEYLEQYAVKHDLLRRIRFGCKVVLAKRRRHGSDSGSDSNSASDSDSDPDPDSSPGWDLTTSTGEHLTCDKLIVSTGLHSKPKWPDIPQDNFTGPVLHSKSLGQQHGRLISASRDIHDIVVVGGCKSAVEACSLFLHASPTQHIHWLIRPSPQGVPILVLDPDMKPNFVAAANTRLFASLSPSIFVPTTTASAWSFRWHNLLHARTSRPGRWLFDAFWAAMSAVVRRSPKYESSANGARIRPTGTNLFWHAAYISLLYRDGAFLKWLHRGERITVHRQPVERLVDGHVLLGSGERVKADAVVYCTGWSPSVDFFEPDEAVRLGIPVPSADQDGEDAEEEVLKWERLMAAADAEVKNKLPFLAQPGHQPASEAPTTAPAMTPFRMYRQVLSPQRLAAHDRSIAFSGMVSSSQTAVTSELVALWSVAWLEGLLPRPLPAEGEMEREVARVNAWMARRYGARGAKDPEIIMEIQSFLDTLLRDLGLDPERKRKGNGKGWLGGVKEWLWPYKASDYQGVVEEFMHNVSQRT